MDDLLNDTNDTQKNIPPENERERTTIAKERFIAGLLSSYGLITTAAKKAGIERKTYYRWISDDPAFKERAFQALDEAREKGLDFAEFKLFELMNNNEPSAIYFYLKCKGKDRGFFEKSLYAIEKSKKPETPLTDEQKSKIAAVLDGDSNDSSGIPK
jgi:hypothetical protein